MEKRVLIEIPEGHRVDFPEYAVYNDKGPRLAYRIGRGGKKLFVVDGKEEDAYDEADGFRFTPDGKGYLYRAVSGGKHLCVRNDGKVRTATPISPRAFPEMSPDGTRIAYPIEVDRGVAYRVGDVTSLPYDSVYRFGFSPGGGHIAFGATRENQHFLVVDGVELGPFRGLEGFSVGDDGVPAYVAHLPDGSSVFRYGKIEEKGDRNDGPELAADGGSWAYIRGTRRGGSLRMQMVHNGRPVGIEYERIPDRFRLSRDGRHVAFLGIREKQAFLVVDGSEQGGGYGVQSTQIVGFSPDGSRVIAAPRAGEETFLRFGDWEGPRLGGFLEAVAVSRDGKLVAYAQRVTNRLPAASRVFLGNTPLGDYARILHLGFTEDGAGLRFVALEEGRIIEGTSSVVAGP